MTRCGHCPRAGEPCVGESVPRLCQLVDPSHPDHRPEYLTALVPTDSGGDVIPHPRVPLADALRANRYGGLQCPYADPPACSCAGLAYCHRLARDANFRDCLECLGPTPKAKGTDP